MSFGTIDYVFAYGIIAALLYTIIFPKEPASEIPLVHNGGRTIDILNGVHFDDLLTDTPDEMRPPAAILFYVHGDNIYDRWKNIAENALPPRERLLVGAYDVKYSHVRPWFKWVPELDLPQRLGIPQGLPYLAIIPPTCNGNITWGIRSEEPLLIDGREMGKIQVVGSSDYKEYCVPDSIRSVRNMGDSEIALYVLEQLRKFPLPKVSKFLETTERQRLWLQKRDFTTTDNILRNYYMSQATKNFTARGFKPIITPPEVQVWFEKFIDREFPNKKYEYWNSESTQVNQHEVPAFFMDLDGVANERAIIAEKYFKPIVESWANSGPLQMTAFYGVRAYQHGAILKNHIDRSSTHVLSLTMSIRKEPGDDWFLEVIDWNGDHVRYSHPPGVSVLYESSKLPHGRPVRNSGGLHFGAFIHFKPLEANWESISENASKFKNDLTIFETYKQNDQNWSPLELTEHAYGEYTSLEGDLRKPEKVPPQSEELSVLFVNRHDVPLFVNWKSRDGYSHLGIIEPANDLVVRTIESHDFDLFDGSDLKCSFQISTLQKEYICE